MDNIILIGILVCLIFLLLILTFGMGYLFGKNIKKENPKPKLPEVSEERQEKIEKKLQAEQRFFEFTG